MDNLDLRSGRVGASVPGAWFPEIVGVPNYHVVDKLHPNISFSGNNQKLNIKYCIVFICTLWSQDNYCTYNLNNIYFKDY